jgi:DNA polymerase-3 subunit beta
VSEPLLTIGAFARAVGLTPSALRHYDECGLLRPAEVDHATGYRYYTPDLVHRAELIAQMREAGVPIDTMRTVLDGAATEAAEVLREHVEAQAARTARAEAAVGRVLAAIEADAEATGSARVTLAGPELAAAIRQVRSAADHDIASPLGSILLDVRGETLDVVATNRFWMAVRTLPVAATGSDGRVVLTVSDTLELASALDPTDEVVLEITGLRLEIDGLEFVSRDVAYPAHRIILDSLDPKRTTAVLSTAELVAAIKTIGRSEVTLTLTDSGAHVGAADDPAGKVSGTVHGEEFVVRLGAALLLRALAVMLGDEVRLEFAAIDRPVVIGSPYQHGFVALLMPVGPG